VKTYRPRYFVTTRNSFAWNMIFSSLEKTDVDRTTITTAEGDTPALEVTRDQLWKIEESAKDKAYTFEAYQELIEGGYARIEPPLRMTSIVRTTRDPKAHHAMAALAELRARRAARA
jgi:hypothetical protein